MKIFYIGRFPPPYGGVTIKNKILYENLLKHVDIEKIELGLIKKMNIRELIKLCVNIINPSNGFIIGASGTSRRIFAKLLYHINRKALNRSLLIVMGGIASKIIADDPKYLKWVAEFKQVYVETEGMKEELTAKGLKNISLFPNCREKPKELINIKKDNNKNIRCLFFSLVSKDKGVDTIIEAADLLNQRGVQYSIDFYGHVEGQYQEEFEKLVETSKYINYCGVFQSDQEDVYSKLLQYDVLLFPTRWKAEGIPGVLVESKIASLPAIVSDMNYNSEIISDGIDGIVLKKNSSAELANAIELLSTNRSCLLEMKENAKLSSERYFIENHIEGFTKILKK